MPGNSFPDLLVGAQHRCPLVKRSTAFCSAGFQLALFLECGGLPPLSPRCVEAGAELYPGPAGSPALFSPLAVSPPSQKTKASSHGIPGIESLNAKPGVVSNVAGDDCKAMFNGSCGDHAVRRVERRPFQLTLAIQYAPPIRY